MSQDNVLRLLERNKKPLSLREIKERLDLTSASRSIRKLLEQGDIKLTWVMVDRKGYKGSTIQKPIQHYHV